MPKRLNRVVIATKWGDRPDERAISWKSRDMLLAEIRSLAAGPAIIEKFNAVGATRPIELEPEEKAILIDAIHVLASNVGMDRLPEDLWELRHAFVDELDRMPRE